MSHPTSSQARKVEGTTTGSTCAPLFHPDFPDFWQVNSSHGPIYPVNPGGGQPENPDIEYYYYINNGENNQGDRSERKVVLLPDQVVKGKVWGSAWIRTHKKGWFIPRSTVSPYWPVYRVVGDTHTGSGGVAPYVVVPSTRNGTQQDNNNNVGSLPRHESILPTEIAQKSTYDANSKLRRPDLLQPVGHMFDCPARLTRLSSEEPGVVVVVVDATHNWWTLDGQTWWPQTVAATFPLLDIPIPSWFPFVAKKTVTEWVTPITKTFIRRSMDHRRGWFIVAMILAEYLMIIGGATAGVEYGWSVQLQLVYVAALVLLVCCEVALVVWLVPNGSLWVKMNLSKLPGTLVKGVLWRWDLYSDVGFCILAFQERNRIASRFWLVPTILTSLVIGGRLAACFYYLRKLEIDETTLSKVSVPSFLTVFALLCQSLQLSDTKLALKSARTELLFEALRTFVEDFPEIVLQAVYLFGPNAPPTCPDCAYGFVLMSLFASIATSCPGLFRLHNAFARYTRVRTQLGGSPHEHIVEKTERQDSEGGR